MSNKYQSSNLRLILGLIIAFGLLVIQPDQVALAQDGEPTDSPARTISVVGVGVANGTPDLAVIDIGVEIENADIGTAVEEVDQTMNDVIAALSELGIASEDIQTRSYNIHQQAPPQPVASDASAEQDVYVVSNTAEIRVRNTDQISEVIQTALDAGANRMYGLRFSLEDTTELANEARQNAVNDAQMRAEELAELFGVTLGDVVQIQENSGGGGRFPSETAAIGGRGGGPAISEGQLSVTIELNVTYAIESS